MRLESRTDRFEIPLRLLAAGITVVSLSMLYAMSASPPSQMLAMTFFLVFGACCSFVLITRGLGVGVSSALGVVVALSISISLGGIIDLPSFAHSTFTIVATTILVLVGRIAGGKAKPKTRTGFEPNLKSGVWKSDVPHTPQPETVEGVLGKITTDFCAWTTTEAARRAVDGASPWPVFGRFVRQALKDRLGAEDVFVYRVIDGKDRLRQLAPTVTDETCVPSAQAGIIGYTVQTGHIYVRNACSDDANNSVAREWSWVLPITENNEVAVIIAVKDIGRKECNRPSVGYAVCDLLNLFWKHVAGLQALRIAQRTDAQTGLLTRTELLNTMRGEWNHDEQENPLVFLAIGLEGLRRLDDRCQWSERDEIVRRLGIVLRQHLNHDDLLARFADDRFMVVMRRMDEALGCRLTERLISCLETDVLKLCDPSGELGVKLRCALLVNGEENLEGRMAQALKLLDVAREDGEPFVCESAACSANEIEAK